MAGLNLKVNVSVLQATRELNRLGTSLVRLKKDAAKAQGAFQPLGSIVSSLTAGIVQLGGAIAVFGAGAAARKAIEFSADFEKSLADINTILGDSEVSLDSYRDKLLQLSTQSSKTLEDLSKGLYQTISAGIPSIEGATGAFAVLEASQRAAVAGLTETNIAVDAVTSVLNTYGRESMFASEVTDQLFTAVRLGKTRFDDLARGIGRVAPIAKEAGVGFDDLLATFTAITRKGISPRETITGLRNLMRGIVKPSNQAVDALESFNTQMRKVGKEQLKLGAGALKKGGLVGFINQLNDFNAGEIEQITQIFPNIRALLPVLALTGDGTQELNDIFKEFNNTAGATTEAFDKVDQVLSETFDKVISNLGRLAVIGSENLLKELNEFLQDLNRTLGSADAEKGARRLFDTISDGVKAITRFGPPALTTLKNIGMFIAAAFAGKAIMAFGPLLASAWGALRLFFTQAQAGALSLQGTLLTLSAGLRRVGAAATAVLSAGLILAPFMANDVANSFRSASAEASKLELNMFGPGEKIPEVLENTKLRLKEVNTPLIRFFDLLSGGAVTQAVFAGQADAVNEKLRIQREELERIAKARGFSTPEEEQTTSKDVRRGKRFDFSVMDFKADPKTTGPFGGPEIFGAMRQANIDAVNDIGDALDGKVDQVLKSERDIEVEVFLAGDRDIADSVRESFDENKGSFAKVSSEIDGFLKKMGSLNKNSILTAGELTTRLADRLRKSGKLTDLEATRVARSTTMVLLQTKLNRLRELQEKITSDEVNQVEFVIDGQKMLGTLAMKNAQLKKAEQKQIRLNAEGNRRAAEAERGRLENKLGELEIANNLGELNSVYYKFTKDNLLFQLSQQDGLIAKNETKISQADAEIKMQDSIIELELAKTPAILAVIKAKISELLVTLGILDAEKDTVKTTQAKAAQAAAQARKAAERAKKNQARLNLETIRNRELEKIRKAHVDAAEAEVEAKKLLVEKSRLELELEDRKIKAQRFSLSMMRLMVRDSDGSFKVNEKAAKQSETLAQSLRDRLLTLKSINDAQKNIVSLEEKARKLELFNISDKAKADLKKTRIELDKIKKVLKNLGEVKEVEEIAERAEDLVSKLNAVKIPDMSAAQAKAGMPTDTDGPEAKNIIAEAQNELKALSNELSDFSEEANNSVAEVFKSFNQTLVNQAKNLIQLAERAATKRSDALLNSFRGTLNSERFEKALSGVGDRIGVGLSEAVLGFEQRLLQVGREFNLEIPVTPVFDVSSEIKADIKRLLALRIKIDQMAQGPDRDAQERGFTPQFQDLLNKIERLIGASLRSGDPQQAKALRDLRDELIAALSTAEGPERAALIDGLRRTIDAKIADLSSEVAQSVGMLVSAELAFTAALEDLKRFFKEEFVDSILSSVAGLIKGDFKLDMMGFLNASVFVPLEKAFNVVDTFLQKQTARVFLRISSFGESLFKKGGVFESFSLTDFSIDKLGKAFEGIGNGAIALKDGAVSAFNGIKSIEWGTVFTLSKEKVAEGVSDFWSNAKASIGVAVQGIKDLGKSETWASFGDSIKRGFISARDASKKFFEDAAEFAFAPEKNEEGKEVGPSRFIKGLKSVRKFIDEGFTSGVKRTVDGLKRSFDIFVKSFTHAFKAGAKIVSSVVSRVLGSVASAIKKPFDMIFGALDQAFGSLMPSISKEKRHDQEKKDLEKKLKEQREEARARREAARARNKEILDNVKALKDVGASNEEIARAQAEFEAEPLIEREEEEEKEEEDSPFDIIDNIFSRALEFVDRFVESAPAILEAFLTKLIESLPALIQGLTSALVSVLNLLAEKLPELITVLTTELVNALPTIIDALIAMIPAIIESIIIALTIIVQKLPDIVIGIIDAIIEAIPLIFDALIESLPQLITALVGAIPRIIGALILLIPRLFYAVVAEVPRIIAAIIKEFPYMLGEFARGLYDGVVRAFEDMLGVLGSLGDAFGNLGEIFTAVGDAFKTLVRMVENLLGSAGSFAGGVWDAMTGNKEKASTGERVVAGILTLGMSELFHDGGYVKDKNPSVLKAFRSAGVQGFSTGGMVGDTLRRRFRAAMADDVPAILQTGEAVLNRDAVRRLGGEPAINAINSGASMAPSGATMAPNVNLSVGISPSAGGLNSVVSALLPLLIESISVTPDGGAERGSRILGARMSSLGYRSVPGKG